VTTFSALRGPVEANWGALVYPGLAGAAGAGLAALSPRLSRRLLVGSVALGALAAAFFAWEVRSPTIARVDSPLVARFRGWKEFAERARAAVAQACAEIDRPPGCNPEDPFVFTNGYQEAAELAYYAGWRRFGPTSARPSQLTLWNDLPLRGSGGVLLGLGVLPETRKTFRVVGPETPIRFEVTLKGQVMHRGVVAPFERYRGPVRRRPGDLP
jgi:hypothetical protein